MSLIRKADTPYSFKGLEIQDAYLVIDDFAKYDKKEKQVTYYVDVYASHSDRDEGKTKILKRSTESCSSDEFDTYFSTAAISADDNQFKQAYLHCMSIELDVSVEGEEPVLEKKYKDWQSDE